MLPALEPDELALFVFGPGVGELVLLRAPPGVWLVIDGCAADGKGYAKQVLDHYGASSKVVVLTHPHLDHARGLAEVVEASTSGDEDTWPVLGMVEPPDLPRPAAGDLSGALDVGVTEHAIATILDRWERHPACKWDMQVGNRAALGEATIEVLSPDAVTRARSLDKWRTGKRFDPNRTATALLVQWNETRLVLGSDLIERPGRGWSAAIAHARPRLLSEHHVLKVPHHGSTKALHHPLLKRPKKKNPLAQWIVTPFSCHDLPSFEKDSGVALLLKHVEQVLLTSLPRAHDRQAGDPKELRLSTLARAARSKGPRFDPETDGFPDCFVAVAFNRDGAPRTSFGDGSVRVRR